MLTPEAHVNLNAPWVMGGVLLEAIRLDKEHIAFFPNFLETLRELQITPIKCFALSAFSRIQRMQSTWKNRSSR